MESQPDPLPDTCQQEGDADRRVHGAESSALDLGWNKMGRNQPEGRAGVPRLTARAGGPRETSHNGHPSPSLQPSPLPTSVNVKLPQLFPVRESEGVGEHTLLWCVCMRTFTSWVALNK